MSMMMMSTSAFSAFGIFPRSSQRWWLPFPLFRHSRIASIQHDRGERDMHRRQSVQSISCLLLKKFEGRLLYSTSIPSESHSYPKDGSDENHHEIIESLAITTEWADFPPPPNMRAILLNQKLDIIRPSSLNNGTCSREIMDAALRQMRDPACGYDLRFGRSALRAWKAFVFPKSPNDSSSVGHGAEAVQLEAAAGRCARQIDFLIKRHQSHETEWIRHHDANSKPEHGGDKVNTQTTIQRFPIVLVLDNLRSAVNVGSIFRTAETCACQAVFTCGLTPHPGGNGAEKIRKSALGSENMVPSQHFATTMEALSHLRTCHPEMTIMAMETTNRSKLYSQIDFRQYYRNESVGDDAEKSLEKRRSEGVALILGNEVTGVDSDLLWRTNELTGTAIIDEIIELPTFGLKNSLNVAVCAPVVIFEILRQWLGEPQQTHDAC